METLRKTTQQDRQIDQDGQVLTPTIPVRSRNPSSETVSRPRPANFARPFNKNNCPEQRQTPLIGRHSSGSDIQDSRSSVQSTSLPSHPQSAFFAVRKPAFERPNRPSQLKLASCLPSVNEAAGPAGSLCTAPNEAGSGSSRSESPGAGVRSSSISRKGKPVFKKIRRNDSSRSNQPIRESETLPASDREETIRALSAAIAAGFNSPSSTTPTRPNITQVEDISGLRMPFPESPASTYTNESFRFPQSIDGDHGGIGTKASITSDIKERNSKQELFDPQHSSPFVQRSVSPNSTHLLLGLGIDHHVPHIPTDHEPSRPAENAGEEADTRQSITSLPELIRRATRLASNLDRGKTASRLGLEDLLGYGNKKVLEPNRESTYSDVLVSFPAPGRSPSPQSRQQGKWDGNEKGTKKSRTRRHRITQRPERRCCGLSLKVFLIVMIVFVILVAAAVLLPIFLILVPKENKSSMDLFHCPASFPCRNGGVSVVDDDTCSCVCVDGFTGNQCTIAADPDCITANLREDSATYDNATVGSDVLSVLSQSQSLFNIPLNTSVLLSVFAANNISCSGENSLVHLNNAKRSERRMRGKRFIVIPGLQSEAPGLPASSHSSDVAAPERTAVLVPRDSEMASTSADSMSQYSTSSASPTKVATASAITASSSPTSTTITAQQTSFAEVVVLFVLAQSRTPSIAVNAQQLMERYFLEGGVSSGNATVEVGFGTDYNITANFAQFSILLGNGTTVGGGSVT